jgi:hypothetical protein
MNDIQLTARRDFGRWRATRWRVIRESLRDDWEKIVPETEVRQLLKWLSEIFFGGDMPCLKFHWNSSTNYPGYTTHRYVFWGKIAVKQKILINPKIGLGLEKDKEGWPKDFPLLDFMQTLMHELTHVWCPT